MRIKIVSDGKTQINLILPFSVLKLPMIRKYLSVTDYKTYRLLLQELKNYTKTYGHFNLVEIDDGTDQVLIVI